MKLCDAVDARGHRQRREQDRADTAALVGVGHGERDLGKARVVLVADKPGVRDHRAVPPSVTTQTKWST